MEELRKEKTEKKEKKEKIEFSDRIAMVTYGVLTLFGIGAMFYVATRGFHYVTEETTIEYGRTAALDLLWSPLAVFSNAARIGFWVAGFLFVKSLLLVLCKRVRSRLIIMAQVSIVLIVVTLVIIGPISEKMLSHQDIPEGVKAFFADQYGADDLELVLEKKYPDNYPYVAECKVKSSAVKGSKQLKLMTYSVWNPDPDLSHRYVFEYAGTTYVLDEVTGVYAQVSADEDIKRVAFINEMNFPDETFRKYVAQYIDTDANGCVTDTEQRRVEHLDLSDMGIADLKGIHYFQYLRTLNCNNNRLTSLDLRQNGFFMWLECKGNQLTELKCHGSVAYLDCSNNQLAELDLKLYRYLEQLDCSNNQLTKLNLQGCMGLRQLDCCENRLTELDVQSCENLEQLDCSENKLKELDVSSNLHLRDLTCSGNLLKKLDVTKNSLFCR